MPETILRGGTALLDAEKILTRLGIAEGMIVADLGCGGGGHFVAPASRLVGRTGHVYAVDIQKAVLHTVESKLRLQHVTNVDLVWSDLEKAWGGFNSQCVMRPGACSKCFVSEQRSRCNPE